MVDFDIRHIVGKLHTGADGLSRHGGTSDEIEYEANEFLYVHLFIRRAVAVRLSSDEYTRHSVDKGIFLEGMQIPEGCNPKRSEAIRREATRIVIHDGHLFKSGRENQPPKSVTCKGADQHPVIRKPHEESGHWGRVGTQQ